MEKKDFIYYFELQTEYGPLYIYEKYKTDPTVKFNCEIPETREFFTQEEGIRGYGTLDFKDRTAVFKTQDIGMDGMLRHDYKKRLAPYEFLMKVAPFLEDEEDKAAKRDQVNNIFRMKANNIGNTVILTDPPAVSEELKNNVARKILTRFVK